MDSLRSLFNCNYFVVSQSNVYITMLLTLKHRIASLGPLYLKLADAWELEFKHRLRQLVEVAPWLDFLGAFRTLVQQWEGDLTVLHRGATLFGENSSPQVRVGFSPAVEGRPHGAASWRHALRRELLPAGKSRFLSSSGKGDLTVLHRGATLFGENSSPQVRVGFSPAVGGRPQASW
jgi:hypothetical protein